MKYSVVESDQFLTDIEESAVWILLSKIEQSESLAEKMVADFYAEVASLKNRLQDFPESGEEHTIKGVRRFPVYEGRYSAKWM